MSRYGQRWRIALILFTLFALVACGPHVPDLTAGSTPVGTAGPTGPGPGEPKPGPGEPKPGPEEPKPGPEEPKPGPIVCEPYVPSSTQPQTSTALPPQTDPSGVKPDFTLDFPKICTVALVNPPETAACLFVAVDLRNQGQGIAAVELAIE